MFLLNGLTFSLLFTAIKGQGQPDTCQEAIVHKCSDYLLTTTLDHDQLVVTKENIENVCSRVDEAEKCIEDYIDNCHPSKTKENYIQESGKDLLETCKFLRTKYIPHLPCFGPLSDTFNRCTGEIKNIVSDQNQILHMQNGTATPAEKRSLCCGIHKIFECVAYPTFSTCGPEAAQTMEVFLRRQLPLPLLTVCDTVTCDGNVVDTTELSDTTTLQPNDQTITYNETYIKKDNDPNSSSQITSICALIISLSFISLLS